MFRRYALTVVLITSLFIPLNLVWSFPKADTPPDAGAAPPFEPSNNPHPPITEADKKRVNFAIFVVKKLLEQKPSFWSKDMPNKLDKRSYKDKDEKCLFDPDCVKKDAVFFEQVGFLHQRYGLVKVAKFAHIVPWSWDQYKNKSLQEKKPAPPKEPAAKASVMPMEAIMPQKLPELHADEFMVHIYVKYEHEPMQWYHLNVILSEDKEGNPVLRRFFTIPVPQPGTDLPEGVVC